VLLEADPQVLTQRIEADEADRTARQWRLVDNGWPAAAAGR
jgi:hypothetical protein